MVNWFKRLFGARSPSDAEQLLSTRENFMALQESAETPWAIFEIADFKDDGQIKVEFNWNPAFIKRINALGFQAETEEDSVQLFFYTSQMKPTSLSGGDDPVQAEETLTLSAPVNRIVT